MIKAEVEIPHWNGKDEGDVITSLKLTNSDDRFVWVSMCPPNCSVRVDINHLEQAVKAIKAGKD